MTVLRIASRKSDLARIQVYQVARALKKVDRSIEFKFQFSQSLGDKNLNDPLWQMPEKGVFTRDLQQNLIDEDCDLVVHSWKDLPIEGFDQTEVVATLEREDSRDLLLFKPATLADFASRLTQNLKIFSSSPRRSHNLPALLKQLLPLKISEIEFSAVRGNVGTRIDKFINSDADGLIVAGAAINRLLDVPDEFEAELKTAAVQLKKKLSTLCWMFLPLKENPTAAAQGALAIEIRKDRSDLRHLLEKINHQATFAAVSRERSILSEHGGGCHQKLGISLQQRSFGNVLSVRGLDEKTQTAIAQWQLLGASTALARAHEHEIWPQRPEESSFFKRKFLNCSKPSNIGAFMVSRADAMPLHWTPNQVSQEILWVSGAKTWRQLAERGYWINGSCEGLGEAKPSTALIDSSLRWCKLSHTQSVDSEDSNFEPLATYELIPKRAEESPKFLNRQHYFWMSATAFKRALDLDPSILTAQHSCGPGNTYKILIPYFKNQGLELRICLDFDHWRQSLLADPQD